MTGARVVETRTSGSAASVQFTAIDGGALVTETRSGAWVQSTFGLRSPFFDVRIDPFLPADRVGMHDPITGLWHQRAETEGVEYFYYGNPADQPFTGDWNGDGVDTMGLYRVSTGFLFLRNSNTQGIADIEIFYGDPGDVPLAGDWDGDGVDTVGVYRPSTRMVYLTNAASGAPAADVSWQYSGAIAGDLVVAGDWDGDGRDTIGLFRPSERRFYLRDDLAAENANRIFDWTSGGATPVTGDWG